ncbi:MAG: AzlD domain-containing protein [Lysinibacillus sp.]|nr:AzlD domain-containing protein [Lysinibacillus sp.]
MNNAIFYILVMAIVTYLIRVLPLTLVRVEIKNIYIKSFLHYVPYVTLAVMIFPAILNSTATFWSALVGFIVAIVFSYFGASIVTVALITCVAVFIVELFLY